MFSRSHTFPAGFIAPCLPTNAPHPPSGSLWLHEIKHDGFRVIARKEGKQIKLYSRPGNDLTYRFPLSGQHTAHYSPVITPFVDKFIAPKRVHPVIVGSSNSLLAQVHQ